MLFRLSLAAALVATALADDYAMSKPAVKPAPAKLDQVAVTLHRHDKCAASKGDKTLTVPEGTCVPVPGEEHLWMQVSPQARAKGRRDRG
jgi:hypothetical protein